MNQELLTAGIVILAGGVLGKFNTWLVDALKRFATFANSSPTTKRAVALVGASLLTWITTHLGIVFSSTDITQLGPTDLYRILVGAVAWLSSMVLHDAKK